MKKLLAGFLSVCLAFSIVGCGSPAVSDGGTTVPSISSKDVSENNSSIPAQDGIVSPSMHALALPSTTEEVYNNDQTLLFSLSYQNVSIDLDNDEIEELIINDLQSRTGSILSEADQICGDAWNDQPEHPNWSNYFLNISYTPTRLDQVLLSLFRNDVSYSGGAHPFVYTDSVTYDLQTGAALELQNIFQPDYSQDVLCALVLKALDGKSEELSYNYQEIVTEQFSEENEIKKDWYFSRNGLCFHFSPYEIAPYSSGTIIAEIPYEELQGILLERYFPTQIESSTGSMYVESYSKEAAQRFQRTTDLTLEENATSIILYSDATVTDLRIEMGTQLEQDHRFIATGVVFAANTVGIGDAIHVSANLLQKDACLRLVYRSNDREVSALITSDPSTGSISLKGE